jgi:hypothetical protein
VPEWRAEDPVGILVQRPVGVLAADLGGRGDQDFAFGTRRCVQDDPGARMFVSNDSSGRDTMS